MILNWLTSQPWADKILDVIGPQHLRCVRRLPIGPKHSPNWWGENIIDVIGPQHLRRLPIGPRIAHTLTQLVWVRADKVADVVIGPQHLIRIRRLPIGPQHLSRLPIG